MTAAAPTTGFRIGEAAKLAGTTTRTIRYYEEIGLLPEGDDRTEGKHRVYRQADVDRVIELIRLKDLLGLTLDELKLVIEAEEARAALRTEFHAIDDPARRREIIQEALVHIDDQLELVSRRLAEMTELKTALSDRRKQLKARLRKQPS